METISKESLQVVYDLAYYITANLNGFQVFLKREKYSSDELNHLFKKNLCNIYDDFIKGYLNLDDLLFLLSIQKRIFNPGKIY